MANAIQKFDWFCRVSSSNFDDFEWTLNKTLRNDCFTNLIYTIPHVIFIVIASTVLFIAGCCTNLRQVKHWYLLRYPGHTLFWLTYVPFAFLLLFSVGEGIISDLETNAHKATEPQLYLPACLAVIAGLVALIYYNQMELWDSPNMIWLLFLYWVAALGGEILRCLTFIYSEEIDLDILRFDLNVVAIILYSVFVLLALHVIRVKVRFINQYVLFLCVNIVLCTSLNTSL